MQIRTGALALMLVLILPMSATLASERPIGAYNPSTEGFSPEEGILKNQKDCPPDTAFFKNVAPGLTNGNGSGSTSVPFTIDAKNVIMNIYWGADNSFAFDFEFDGLPTGRAHIVGVTSDTNNFLYDYVDFYPGKVATGTPVFADGNLNLISEAADVNHLDLCLSAFEPDVTDPEIAIVVEPITVGPVGTVGGTVTVTATVTDNVEVDPSSVSAEVNGEDLGQPNNTPGSNQYTWSWNTTTTTPDLDGNFTVTVSATDTSGNTATQSIIVAADVAAPTVTISEPTDGVDVVAQFTVTATAIDNIEVSAVTAIVQDAGGNDVEDLFDGTPTTNPDEFQWMWDPTTYADGDYTIVVTATDTSGNEGTDQVTVTAVTSLESCIGIQDDTDQSLTNSEGCNFSGVQIVQVPQPKPGCDDLTGTVCSFTEFLLTPNPALNTAHPTICTGENAYADPRVDQFGFPQTKRKLNVFAELGGAPDGFTGDELILDEFTYGNPCFAVVYGKKNFNLLDAFDWPQGRGLTIIRTQFPNEIPGFGPVTACYPIDGVGVDFDLQEAAEATYQTDYSMRMRENTAAAMTNRCFNPRRMATFDFSLNVLNTKEHGGINFALEGPQAVLNFKFERAGAKFDALELALFAAESQLLSPKFSELTRKFNQARSQFDKQNLNALARAQADLEDLLFEVKNGTWALTANNNPGDVQMRTENLIWRIILLQEFITDQGL